MKNLKELIAIIAKEDESILDEGMIIGGYTTEPAQPMDALCVEIDGICIPHAGCIHNIYCLPHKGCAHNILACDSTNDSHSIFTCL